MLTTLGFAALMLATVLAPGGLAQLRRKPGRDWALDVLGLTVQGSVIPLLQAVGVAVLCRAVLPRAAGTVELGGQDWLLGFVLNFVVVDYLYYWNHRFMHRRRFWPLHRVHHSVESMDVLGTSRNTLWTSLLFVYLWVNGAAFYFLAHPAGFATGAACTAVLDLWRHSRFYPAPGRWLDYATSEWLISPLDHAWHHASEAAPGNYGANLKVWDRIHGTYLQRLAPPPRLGQAVPGSLVRQLLWPFP